MMLMCLHRFHPACVGEWFKTKDKCPICKQQVSVQQQHHQMLQQESNQRQQHAGSEIPINRMLAEMRVQADEDDELDQGFV